MQSSVEERGFLVCRFLKILVLSLIDYIFMSIFAFVLNILSLFDGTRFFVIFLWYLSSFLFLSFRILCCCFVMMGVVDGCVKLSKTYQDSVSELGLT